ncbi:MULTISPECIES: DUF3187 family protein [unclassified Nitratiruptor]|uniref:DUF3187 family protein n=1 Tax=unclassified Nitratiruptor TaxID=2624044 RepID=UPI001915D820|nr:MULTISPECIES: DUF3187 family protein [unclassified Nitratiruptor]BCD61008.1 hypothetical protein NitYY0810_C1789 [Nitratiruptor sp. YY08-10]BCD64940.1 hypothetical protein NitYY0814_C1797 [Nitratiruptor sp. YY08-14]
MKKFFTLFLLSITLFAAQPLLTTTMHPFRLAFYSFYPQNPQIWQDEKWHTQLSLSETNDYDEEKAYLIDYEITTLTLAFSKNTNGNAQFRIILPAYSINGGFLDSFLNWFHRATATLPSAHNQYGNNKVHFFFGSIHKTSSYATFGNVQLEYTHRLPWTIKGVQQALHFGIKLPTAKKNSGFGSGKTDTMIGWLGYKKFTKSSLLLNIQAAKIGKYTQGNIAKSKKYLYTLYAQWQKPVSFGKVLLGYRFLSSAYDSPYASIDSCSNIVTLGLATHWFGKQTIIFLNENLAPFRGAPDITIGINISL